ncbi:hypothetical protein BHE90_016352 [Fusarium euwallaceae]|uniref:Uncharacterized protein n=1 Tax=Fusarium euwallaceae TaxID=1147111 RepID=A0A430L0K9_9HYPO|nr:hypothetical protein BHE90_016352 [Fusarium euwallaceae]
MENIQYIDLIIRRIYHCSHASATAGHDRLHRRAALVSTVADNDIQYQPASIRVHSLLTENHQLPRLSRETSQHTLRQA